MSIMEKFAIPHKDYYSWQIGNGQGYETEVVWSESKRRITNSLDSVTVCTTDVNCNHKEMALINVRKLVFNNRKMEKICRKEY